VVLSAVSDKGRKHTYLEVSSTACLFGVIAIDVTAALISR